MDGFDHGAAATAVRRTGLAGAFPPRRRLRAMAACCAIFAMVGHAGAQTVPAQRARPALTQAQIDDGAKKFYDNCAVKTDYLRNIYECSCLTDGYRQVAMTKQTLVMPVSDLIRVGKSCPAPKATTYAWVYRSCDEFIKHKRADHAEFCGCTAEWFSTRSHENPNSGVRQVEALRHEAMKACGL